MKRWELINEIARRIDARSYLEIGVFEGTSFHEVRVSEKVGVDPAPNSRATAKLDSDTYFSTLSPEVRFDLVFIDGLHVREQVARDIQNAIARLTPGGAIVVHDCDPPDERAGGTDHVANPWCGDVWRAWIDFRARAGVIGRSAFVVDTDLGCGVIGAPWAGMVSPIEVPTDAGDATWEAFQANRAAWLNLVSVETFRRSLS